MWLKGQLWQLHGLWGASSLECRWSWGCHLWLWLACKAHLGPVLCPFLTLPAYLFSDRKLAQPWLESCCELWGVVITSRVSCLPSASGIEESSLLPMVFSPALGDGSSTGAPPALSVTQILVLGIGGWFMLMEKYGGHGSSMRHAGRLTMTGPLGGNVHWGLWGWGSPLTNLLHLEHLGTQHYFARNGSLYTFHDGGRV